MAAEPKGAGRERRGGGIYRFEAHAIVSADDMIADRDGKMPPALRHPADWARFQAALDRAAAVVLGRRSHEANPDRHGRRRIVMSRQVEGLERREDGWWWNPAGAPLGEALAAVAPEGGLVAIPGGRGVFDWFLAAGLLDVFNLSRVEGLRLPGGVPVFSACAEGKSAETVLDEAGLRPGERAMLDADVSLTVWRQLGG